MLLFILFDVHSLTFSGMSGSSSGSSAGTNLVKRVYLDYNATTPLAPEVIQAVEQSMQEAWGNPSSAHEEGARARTVINQAREDVARMIGATPQDVLFMSGGTEVRMLHLFQLHSVHTFTRSG